MVPVLSSPVSIPANYADIRLLDLDLLLRI